VGASARLFLALWPPPAALRALLAWRAAIAWPAGAAIVAPERLHLTLHFIGAVPAERLAAVTQALALPGEPFELRFGHVEAWARGLVALCPETPPPALAALHARLADALRELGLPVEPQPYRPHVTLARKAAGAAAGEARFAWPVERYALVQSANGYRTLASYALAPAPSAGARPQVG
jgi:2'-5' RNA ligase